MIAWFTRIDLPHEFRDGIDHMRDPIDIKEFVVNERQIEGTSPADLARAHYARGFLLQVGLATDMPDTKRAHWHPAQMDNTQGQTAHPPFKQRYAARVSPALDFGPAEGRAENRHMLFQILGTMPPESRLRFVKIIGTRHQGRAGRTRAGTTRHDKK